jgi:predicted RecB family nuclease
MGFEEGVLLRLAKTSAKHRDTLKSIADRLVDPLPIFRAHVYAPGFAGSFSIKAVAPAILGESASYDGMEVGEGAEAQISFLEMIHKETDPNRKAELKQALLNYCRKDTQGMMELVFWLQALRADPDRAVGRT